MNEMQKKKEADKHKSLERAKKKEDKLRAQIPATSKLKELEIYSRGAISKPEGADTSLADTGKGELKTNKSQKNLK